MQREIDLQSVALQQLQIGRGVESRAQVSTQLRVNFDRCVTWDAQASSFSVRAPRPGPISSTWGRLVLQTKPAMRSRMSGLERKCCPNFCAKLASHVCCA